MRDALAILCGALLLVWPAFLNAYPILFSDTGGLIEMGLEPSMGWDKPWVYGPIVAVLSLRQTLWLPLAAQGLLTSYVLWLTQAILQPPRRTLHLVLCAILALGSAAPWFTATLMPDLFAPIAVLCLAVLAISPSPSLRTPASVIATIAIAAHLSLLIVAAACIAAAALVRRRIPWRPGIPLAAALAFLLASNLVGHGVLAISPYGSVFALARLVGDGPARQYIDRVCPEAGYRVCAWKGRLTDDSDAFLWEPNGPMWANDFGPTKFASEAARIVAATLAEYPLQELAAAARNTARQLARVQLGDTLGPDYLDTTVQPRIALYFPEPEARRATSSRQATNQLGPWAEPLNLPHTALLILGAAATLWTAIRHWRTALGTLSALILAGVLANAAATGSLSTVHDRYQARIAWLLLLPSAFLIMRQSQSKILNNPRRNPGVNADSGFTDTSGSASAPRTA